ncbi:MAG: SMK killer toxin resistance protein [Cirrosporium novae-zelandiae]|nr:MAG: SMK killer toxin resistance protein [Cirrosporium novae-zelandiae]
MSTFLEDLWNSVFTPGTTPTLLVATNASFAALQFVLLLLLVATYSIHFLILSILCGGLWWAINWFVAELSRAQDQEAAKEERKQKEPIVPRESNESDTETEAPDSKEQIKREERTVDVTLKPPTPGPALKKRENVRERSGYVSTDSEWEKVDDSDDKDK